MDSAYQSTDTAFISNVVLTKFIAAVGEYVINRVTNISTRSSFKITYLHSRGNHWCGELPSNSTRRMSREKREERGGAMLARRVSSKPAYFSVFRE